MDRQIIYAGAVPLDTDLLNAQLGPLIGLGYLAQAAFGAGTFVDGLAIQPTSPASMSVIIGAGMIGAMTTVDGSAFGSVAPNGSPLLKMGVNVATTTLTFTAPASAGYAQNFLIQAAFSEADTNPVTLPYYNASNPTISWAGPANSGVPQNTQRIQRVSIAVKAGAAATAGSQTTPSADTNWVPLYVVTLINGQTTITSASYTLAGSAPFVPQKLPTLRTRLNGNLNLFVSPNGNDSINSGLSLNTPFATLQKAWNSIVNTYDLNGYSVTVNIANGTYTGGLLAAGNVLGLGSGNAISFVGNTGSPSSVVVSTSNAHAIESTGGATILVAGMTLSASGTAAGTAACAIIASTAAVYVTGPMIYGTCSGYHIWAANGGTIGVGAGYTISGSALAHYVTTANSFLNVLNAPTITLSGTPAFSTAFAVAGLNSNIQAISVTFAGAGATGPRYSITANAVIATNGAGANYFPGSSAGAYGSGGQYV